MPFTVITLKSVPMSLRGDLTKWMQEIATGVYVGNFNTRVREQLWKRVCESVGEGEATMSYSFRNELGYNFQTVNAQREVIESDGIPLIMIPNTDDKREDTLESGFSNAARFRKARRHTGGKSGSAVSKSYVVIDLETTGLEVGTAKIIEMGAVKKTEEEISYYQCLLNYEGTIPQKISELTGITDEMLEKEGVNAQEAISRFLQFIGEYDIVGYNVVFDVNFLNAALIEFGMPVIHNKVTDLMAVVKREHMFQPDYKLQTTLNTYDIDKEVPHRALEDARLIYELSRKVKKF